MTLERTGGEGQGVGVGAWIGAAGGIVGAGKGTWKRNPEWNLLRRYREGIVTL